MRDRNAAALKEQALDRILDLFPDDRNIYEKWQKYIQIYSAGYKDAPDNMDDVLSYWNVQGDDYEAGHTYGMRIGTLECCLMLLNSTIRQGQSREYLFDLIQTAASPECFAIIYLLYSCLQQTKEERLLIAKQDFLNNTTDSDDENVMLKYGIDLATVKAWRQEAPQSRPYASCYHAAEPVLLRGALEVLRQQFPDDESAYDEVETGLKIYLTGFYDSVKACVKTWLQKSGNPQQIILLLQELNSILKKGTPPDQLTAEDIVDQVPDYAKPLFQFLIKTYQQGYKHNITGSF